MNVAELNHLRNQKRKRTLLKNQRAKLALEFKCICRIVCQINQKKEPNQKKVFKRKSKCKGDKKQRKINVEK